MSQVKGLFRTPKLSLAAFLLANDHQFQDFEMDDPHGEGVFIFQKDTMIAESISAYFVDDPPIPVRTFLTHLNHLRDIVMTARKKTR